MKETDKIIKLFAQAAIIIWLISVGTYYGCWSFVASMLIAISIFLIVKYNKQI